MFTTAQAELSPAGEPMRQFLELARMPGDQAPEYLAPETQPA